jgi:nucleotide-binding universal stress UspA family protein
LKILVPIDGSKPSKRAIDYIIESAKKEQGAIQLIALHQLFHRSEYSFLAGRAGDLKIHSEDKIKEEFEQWLDEINKKINHNKIFLSTDIVISSTHTVPLMVDYAEQERIDQIVIGSKVRSGISGLILGSVAREVVTQSRCPVTVIK